MNFEYWLNTYGYIAIFIGALFEGELIVSLSGAFVYQGIFNPYMVIIVSTIATTLSEQICFYIGRYLGKRYLSNRFTKFQYLLNIIAKYPIRFILMCRFLYGFRSISPFIIGSAKIDSITFSIYNFLAAILWSITSVGVGYCGAWTSKSLGYSNFIGYIITLVLILLSMTLVGWSIKAIIKDTRTNHNPPT